MATARQIAANRMNAQKSTGPKTDAGKAVSRGNALKHGLAGDGVVVPEGEAEVVGARVEEWTEAFRPACPVEAFLVAQLATEGVRVERAQREERALLERRRARAEAGWEESRRLEAEEVGRSLARQPAWTVARLRQTTQGVDWLLTRWDGLGRAAASGRTWDDAQRALALDLLGVPTELREGPTPVDLGSGPEAAEEQAKVAARQMMILSRLRAETLARREASERDAARLGDGPGDAETERALAQVRRYESACQRRLHRALGLLLSGKVVERTALPRYRESRTEPTPPPAPAVAPPAETPEPPTETPDPALDPVPAPRPTLPDTTDNHLARKGNRLWRKQQRRRERERSEQLAVPA